MTIRSVTVLIPCHSLEDFPTELPDDQATSLLNAFAVAWHPRLLAASGALPTWDRSDEPPDDLDERLFIVPTACEEWLPGGWVEHAELQGAIVISGLSDRSEMLAEIERILGSEKTTDSEFVADFLALGTCWLQMELLTRHMHHYSNLDEVHLEREAVTAATAVENNDHETAKKHLKNAFEELLEARERFYPIGCYIIDLCLLIPRLADEQSDALNQLMEADYSVNFVTSAEDWQAIADNHSELVERVKSRWTEDRVDLIGGDLREAPLTSMPIGSVLWEFDQGRRRFQQLFNRTPVVWGRRRYGLSGQLPQILSKSAFEGALHLVMDDGLYPEEDASKIRWEGIDGSGIDAVCRFPLTAEGAASFLRFPLLMAESMEQDQSAAVLFARWPEVKSPWLGDLHRMNRYAPVLGEFVTLTKFFRDTDQPVRVSNFEAKEYAPPFFIQTAARLLPDPLSRFADHVSRRERFEAGQWCSAMSKVLIGQPVDDNQTAEIEELVEKSNPDAEAEDKSNVDEKLNSFVQSAGRELSQIILHGADNQPGLLLINTLSETRTEPIALDDWPNPPAISGPVKAVQFDNMRRTAILEIPGSGFVWLPRDGAVSKSKSEPAMAEENVLRNEFFEVSINPTTGGIARIKNYGRVPNRLSQQLAYRFPHERQIPVGDDGYTEPSYYSRMVCRDLSITSTGPAVGEIVTTGDLLDDATDTVLAEYRQTVRVSRFRRVVDVDIELTPRKTPDADPWTNYYAARFAWHDPGAVLTRAIQQGAHGIMGERFESTDYLEIASDDDRTTILFHGLPSHRKTDTRMLDSLLITQGESRRQFKLSIAVDEPYPMQATRAAQTPIVMVPTEVGPPKSGNTGWLFHINAKNAQVLRVLPAMSDSKNPEWTANGFALRLLETEGRSRNVVIRCFRNPQKARTRDFQGRTLDTLVVKDDQVHLPIAPYEIADVEFEF
ncbi:glycoside hydrolase family 38 N-terminal domain-containing protein [Thalassoroseus pseudoceratinae]|uniref:glycoside hydrolase family 38 N-terminal domain-containing protein n=1 Tax=Thalassoroseus pseudoceratinae TaxID=2713176 RepID=UPI0014213033|nr:hypothetical protein [Thalassoroseus pseudoceratinae]